ncbi:MAG: hypothetical protein CML03_00460 [Pseudooceanicola sp.]|nr:hypothetical protein [Pseudooceanicola sp.]
MLSLSNKLTINTHPIYRFVNKYSIDFDGTDDYIRISDADSLDEVTTNNFSVSCWIKTTATDGSICVKRDSGAGFELGIGSGKVSWYLNDGSGYADTDDTATVNDGEWHHIVWVFDRGGSAYRYIDGVNSGTNDSITSASGSLANSVDLGIGARLKTTPDNYYTGKIDELAIFDRTLTQAEITKIYNSGNPINLMLNAAAYQSANPLITCTKSMEFDGVDDYLIANSTLGSFTGSFSCWVIRDNTSSYDYILDTRGASSGGTGYIYFNTGDNTLIVSSGTRYVDGVAATEIPTDGKWHNVVVTGMTLDIDEDIRFGRSKSGSHEYEGKITEAGIWDRTLTALEVASLYNQGVPTNLLVSRGDYVATNLVGYWKMGDGTNDEYPVIYDQVEPTISAEYVVNGDFSDGLTGWIAPTQDGAYQEDTGSGMKMYSGSPAGASNAMSTSGTLNLAGTEGKTYRLDITASDFISMTSCTIRLDGVYDGSNIISFVDGTQTIYFVAYTNFTYIKFFAGSFEDSVTINSISIKELGGNPAIMTNMVESNITNQYPLTKIRNYYRMGDGTNDEYPVIYDQVDPTLGAELLTNGDFSNTTSIDTNISPFAGWNNLGTHTSTNHFTITNNECTCLYTSGSAMGIGVTSLTIGKLYKLTINITDVSSGGIKIYIGTTSTSYTTTGFKTLYKVADSVNFSIYRNSGATDVTFDNVSVKQVNGNPAIMTNMSASDIVEDTP